MTQQVSPLDATFLELEDADDSAHMHIGAVMLFDALPAGPPLVEEVRLVFDERLGLLPRYRQRLSKPRPGPVRWPAWEADANFDIAAHVRRATVPHPGGEEELREWAADYWSHRLDRARPLWEVVVVDGLADGRWALASKTHHCMVDGMGSVDVAHLMLDAEPSPPDRDELATGPDDDEDERAALLPGWLAASVRAAGHGAQAMAGAARHPRDAAARALAVVELLVRDEVLSAPRTSINQPIGATRRFEVVRAGVDELKAIAHERGGTLNDVVLAVTTAGLRALLLARDEKLPAGGLRAMVPMNARLPEEQLALGNRISSLFVELPVAIEDSLERYAAVCQRAESQKAGTQSGASDTLLKATALAPPVVHSVLARGLFAKRLFNVTITNVKGPAQALYAFGAPMLEVWPLVPLAAEHSVGVAVVSYDGDLFFGLVADHATVPDLDVMTEAIADEIEALRVGAAEHSSI
jgi:WS/DGAT/MGAT family acyltransferase